MPIEHLLSGVHVKFMNAYFKRLSAEMSEENVFPKSVKVCSDDSRLMITVTARPLTSAL